MNKDKKEKTSKKQDRISVNKEILEGKSKKKEEKKAKKGKTRKKGEKVNKERRERKTKIKWEKSE